MYNNINIVIPNTEAWANIEVYVLTTTAHQHWGMMTVLYLNFEVWHINELYLMSKCIEVYEGFCNLGLAKLVNCIQILGHVAYPN